MRNNTFKMRRMFNSFFTKTDLQTIKAALQNHRIVLILILLFPLFAAAQETPTRKTIECLSATPVKQLINVSEIHQCKFELKKDAFIQFRVDQQGVDVLLRLTDENKNELAQMNTPGRKEGFETLSFIAKNDGVLILEISRLSEIKDKGAYAIRKEVSRKATVQDRQRVETERLFMEGMSARATAGQAGLAIKRFSAALTGWQELSDRYMAEITKLLVIQSTARATFIEAQDLFKTGIPENFEPALSKFQKAADLYHEGQEKDNEGAAYAGAATVVNYLGRKESSIDFYKKALNIFQESGNRSSEAEIWVGLGTVYNDLNKRTEAIDSFIRALNLYDKLDDRKAGSAAMSYYIGVLSRSLYKKQPALEYLKKSVPLFQSIGRNIEAASALNEIGAVYQDLGDYKLALEAYARALDLFANNESGKALIKNNMGDVYYNSGKYQNALDAYTEALTTYLKTQEISNEGAVLTNIGLVHSALGKYDEALITLMDKALPLKRQVGDKNGEAYILNNVGEVYLQQDKKPKALEYFLQSLPLYIAVGDKNGEATALGNIMSVLASLNNKRMAIFFGKLSINIFQELRSNAKGLPIENQKTFLRRLDKYYQSLIQLLIEEGQIDQAVEILNLYQDQQFFDFDRNLSTATQQSITTQQSILSQREAKKFTDYVSLSKNIREINIQIEDLNRQIDNNQPNKIESRNPEQKKLDTQLISAMDNFVISLKNTEKEFIQPSDPMDKVKGIEDILKMQEALEILNTNPDHKKHAAIYTFVAQDELNILLITPQKDKQEKYLAVKTFTYPIKAVDLSRRVKRFLRTLQHSNLDTYEAGNEIYKTIFQSVSTEDRKTTLEAELIKYKPDVLHWSLDGVLRNIPMAALSDEKKQYLVEKYETAVFTRANKVSFIREPEKWTSCLGLGTTKEYPDFSALQGVAKEADELCNPQSNIIKGTFLLDDKFKLSAIENLNTGNKPPLIHISTHLRFQPGDAQSSYLLLGDGTPLSLYDIQKYPNLFNKVDLVTAAACDTGKLERDGDGKEIDAFAEIIQRLGAASVIATLWKVDDAGTSQLMIDFYKLYSQQIKKSAGNIPDKSYLLRQAQLNLMKLEKADGANCGGATKSILQDKSESDYEGKLENDFKPRNPAAPCEHPYYWAPFVLYGSPK